MPIFGQSRNRLLAVLRFSSRLTFNVQPMLVEFLIALFAAALEIQAGEIGQRNEDQADSSHQFVLCPGAAKERDSAGGV